MEPPPSPSAGEKDDSCTYTYLCRIESVIEQTLGHVCSFYQDHFAPDIETLDTMRTQARERSINIFRQWILLNAMLKRHEDVIRRRWAKKSNKQRTAILLNAWPGMAETHRPDFAALRSAMKNKRHRPGPVQARDAYMIPCINLEDLVDTLPLFIHTRGRNLPCHFAFTDDLAPHRGISTKFGVGELDRLYMFIFQMKTPNSYGEPLVMSPPFMF